MATAPDWPRPWEKPSLWALLTFISLSYIKTFKGTEASQPFPLTTSGVTPPLLTKHPQLHQPHLSRTNMAPVIQAFQRSPVAQNSARRRRRRQRRRSALLLGDGARRQGFKLLATIVLTRNCPTKAFVPFRGGEGDDEKPPRGGGVKSARQAREDWW